MARSRASAKKAGSQHERDIADYLALHVDDRIDRRAKTGAKDKGDIGGLRWQGQRIVIECKNVSTNPSIGPWLNEAEVERGNDDALVGMVVYKRHGSGKPEDQIVVMTMGDLVAFINGNRDHLKGTE